MSDLKLAAEKLGVRTPTRPVDVLVLLAATDNVTPEFVAVRDKVQEQWRRPKVAFEGIQKLSSRAVPK